MINLFEKKKNIIVWRKGLHKRKAIRINEEQVLETYDKIGSGKSEIQILSYQEYIQGEFGINGRNKAVENNYEDILPLNTTVTKKVIEGQGLTVVELSSGHMCISSNEEDEFVLKWNL